MAGAIDSRTWSVQKDWDQAKLFIELSNFPAVKNAMPPGQTVDSKQISIARSRFSVKVYRFSVKVYPSGPLNPTEKGHRGE